MNSNTGLTFKPDQTMTYNQPNPIMANLTMHKSPTILTAILTATTIALAACTVDTEHTHPTPVPMASVTPVPTATPIAIPSPLPTATPQSVVFPTPLPTATPFAWPSPLPTSTPAPTATPMSVRIPTPLPTATPFAVPSPLPTSTPAPTATPVTVRFPTPLPTATPIAVTSEFQNMDEVAKKGVARISTGCTVGLQSHGTAWLVKTDKDDGQILLSARHVICESPRRWGDSSTGIEWPIGGRWGPGGLVLSVVAHSEELDVVLLKPNAPDFDLSQWLHKWELVDWADAPGLGDSVRHLTTRDVRKERLDPLDIVPFVSDGVVSWADGTVLHTNTSSMGGESGGIIVNADMEAIGLIRNVYLTLPRVEGGYRRSTGLTTVSTHALAIREFLIDEGYLNP